MKIQFPKDITIIIILTLISILCIYKFPLVNYPINIFSYIFVGTFSGYALISALYPKKRDLRWFKRIFASIIVSILLTLPLTLISTYNIIGINISTGFLIIGILTIILLVDALEGNIRTSQISKNNDLNYKSLVKEDNNDEITNDVNKTDQIRIDMPSGSKQSKIGFFSLDLILVFFVTLICVFILINKSNETIISLIAISILLFLPGYSLVSAIYPKKEDLNGVKRVSLSFGFPLMALTLGILINNINPIAISLNFILILIITFTIVFIIIAYLRRRRVKLIEKINNNEKISNSYKSQTKPELISKETSSEVSKNVSLKQEISNAKFVTKDLLLIFLTTLITIIFLISPKLEDTLIRTILGLILIIFIPGYSLVVALFPRKDELEGIERAALSFGLSIAVTPLIVLILNYTPWGIRLTPILISLSAFTIIMVIIGYIRRKRVPEGEKYYVNFGGFISSIKGVFKRESKTSKILSIILLISIILAISTAAYIIIIPNQGETFTEFYILGSGGQASDYPTNLTVGQKTSVIIGIVNHEQKTVNYNLIVTSNGNIITNMNITLTNGNNTKIPYTFSENTKGQKDVQFLLYKLPDHTNVYRSLHLFVEVT